MDSLWQNTNPAPLDQTSAEKDGFQQAQPRKTAQTFEVCAANRQALVAINDSGQSGAKSRGGIDHSVKGSLGRNVHREAAADDALMVKRIRGCCDGAGLERA